MESVREWLDERAAEHKFSGVVLVWRDGAPMFEHAAGLAHRGHGVPNTVDTRFAIASIGKILTATTALRLVDQGVLDLHRPLVEVLPPEHRPQALTEAHTLHQLLSHTSGLANYSDDDDETWDSWNANWDRIPTYHARRPADLLPLFADLPAVAEPGAKQTYCDANYVLVGLVIEAATGRPFEDVTKELVLDPAGMADTGYEDLDTEPVRLATGYVIEDDVPFERWKTNVYMLTASPMPDGGQSATAHDLARFVDALPELLAPDTFAAMTTPIDPDHEEPYGLGCLLGVEDGEVLTIGHVGGDPGVTAMLTRYLAEETTVVIVCNFDRGAWPASQFVCEQFGLHDPQ